MKTTMTMYSADGTEKLCEARDAESVPRVGEDVSICADRQETAWRVVKVRWYVHRHEHNGRSHTAVPEVRVFLTRVA